MKSDCKECTLKQNSHACETPRDLRKPLVLLVPVSKADQCLARLKSVRCVVVTSDTAACAARGWW